MKVTNHLIELKTAATLDFIDLTDKIKGILKKTGVKNGIINIQSLHTTMAVLVQEAEPLLIMDIKKMLNRVAPRTVKYMHDNFEIRTVNMCDGECANGHSHCKATFLPTSCNLNIVGGAIQLGTWQRIFAIELDRSRPRGVAIQIIGA